MGKKSNSPLPSQKPFLFATSKMLLEYMKSGEPALILRMTKELATAEIYIRGGRVTCEGKVKCQEKEEVRLGANKTTTM